MKRVGVIAAVVVAILALGVLSLRVGVWRSDPAAVRAKYAAAPSQFVSVNGIKVHLRDEGEGPAIVMVHSSMSDLNIWNQVADVLKKKYRIVRFDWPPYGFSEDPTGNFSSAYTVALLGAVVDQLHLDRFTLIASSSGATHAVIYAASHPDRVEALALSSLPLSLPPGGSVDWRVTAIAWLQRHLFPDFMPRFYYEISLPRLVGDPHNLSEDVISWYYETNNLPGNFARVRRYLAANQQGLWKTGANAPAGLIEKPILLQWGDSDPVLPAYLGDKAKADFAKGSVTLIHYKDVGHYPMLEIPQKMATDIMFWMEEDVDRPVALGPP